MDYSIRSTTDEHVVSATGMLTFEDHAKMKSLIGELQAADPKPASLDLAGIRAIDSAGIGLLLLLNDSLKSAGLTLTLHNPQPTPRKILDVAKISEIIEIR